MKGIIVVITIIVQRTKWQSKIAIICKTNIIQSRVDEQLRKITASARFSELTLFSNPDPIYWKGSQFFMIKIFETLPCTITIYSFSKGIWQPFTWTLHKWFQGIQDLKWHWLCSNQVGEIIMSSLLEWKYADARL